MRWRRLEARGRGRLGAVEKAGPWPAALGRDEARAGAGLSQTSPLAAAGTGQFAFYLRFPTNASRGCSVTASWGQKFGGSQWRQRKDVGRGQTGPRGKRGACGGGAGEEAGKMSRRPSSRSVDRTVVGDGGSAGPVSGAPAGGGGAYGPRHRPRGPRHRLCEALYLVKSAIHTLFLKSLNICPFSNHSKLGNFIIAPFQNNSEEVCSIHFGLSSF